jgi:hypothetical protein
MIYDCSNLVGNLRPKNVVFREIGKFCETVVNRKDSRTTTFYDLRPFVKRGHVPVRTPVIEIPFTKWIYSYLSPT